MHQLGEMLSFDKVAGLLYQPAYHSASGRIQSIGSGLCQRPAPQYPAHLFGPGDGVAEWEGAYTRLGVWLRDTVRKVSKYDVEGGGQLESISSSHTRYDAEEEFSLDSQKYLALLLNALRPKPLSWVRSPFRSPSRGWHRGEATARNHLN